MQTLRILALSAVSLGLLQAGDWDKQTVFTINQDVQLPTTTLQPGTYVFRLTPSDSNRHIVEVYSKDERHLITRFLALPNERLRPTGKTTVTFWEAPAGQPAALRAWFYPGKNFGQEFMYRKADADRISVAAKATVPEADYKDFDNTKSSAARTDLDATAATTEGSAATLTNPTEPETAATTPVAVAQTAEAPARPAPEILAQNNQAPIESTPTGAASSATFTPANSVPDRNLPQTGSNLPLIGLIGLLALGIGLALSKITVVS